MTDAELATMLRPMMPRIVAAVEARLRAGEEDAYGDEPKVKTFSAFTPAFTAADAANYANYFGDDNGLFSPCLHQQFGCSKKEFADHSGLVRKQITDKNGRRVWHWVRKDQPPATPQSKPAQPAAEPQQPGKLDRIKTAVVDKLSKSRGGRAILAMGRVGLKLFHALEHRLLFAAKKTQEIAVAAAKERGLSDEQAAKLAHALYAADFVGGYATGGAALAIAGPVAGKVAAVMPSASVVYLAYSTARNPGATWKAALKVIKGTFSKGEGTATHAAEDAPPDISAIAGPLADALADCDDPDWFTALYCAALGETEGDVEAALEMAQAAMHEHAPGGEEGDTAEDDDAPEEMAAAKGKPGKVLKVIEVKTKKGTTYKRKVWVNAEDGGKTKGAKKAVPEAAKPKPKKAPAPKEKEKKPAKPDPKQVAEEVKAQLAGDASKLTPKAVKDFEAKLASLTKPQVAALAKERALALGKTKADHIAALVAEAKKLKKEADAGKRPTGKKAAKKIDLPDPGPVPQPEKKREVGEIDYKHKDANAPIVKQMMTNATAAKAVRAVLEATVESDAKIEAARKAEQEARSAWDAELAKKRKNWGKINKLMTAAGEAQKSRWAVEEQERKAGRENALNALYTALKSEEMGGHVLAELNARASTGSKEIEPLPAAGTEKGDSVRRGVVEGVGFVNRVLGNHKLDLTFAVTPEGRAFASRYVRDHPEIKSLVALGGDRGAPQTVVHEIGHQIEFHKPGVEALANQFLAYRIADEAPTSLREKYGSGYDAHEFGHKDDFERAMGSEMSAYYVGKKYPGGETEVVSMGLDRMFSNPMEFAKADPEYFHFICHVLSM